ncbi:MAG: HAD family hydrolase [Thermoanaerobaculia bacterium]|nr:HAD family hydrolase [Thermoanaerobaculia bacterium]
MTGTAPLPPIDGLVFDLDGTLADSIEHYYRIACEILELAGAPPVSRRRVCELMGRGDPEIMRRLFPPDHPDVDATLARIVRERAPAWRAASPELPPVSGVVSLLRRLHGRGVHLGIATSSNRAVPCLDSWGVRQLFGAVVGREDVSRRKPHPEVVLRCLEALDVDPGTAAYVGDSPIDMEAGRAAGVTAIGVLTGVSDRAELVAAGAHLVIGSAVEIAALLPSQWS